MEIKQNLVSSSKYDIKCPYERTPQFYVVHNTYNDAPAKNEVSYMIGNNNKVSFHWAEIGRASCRERVSCDV